jgi:hypothetical protein
VESEEKKLIPDNISKISGFIMVVLYLVIGTTIIFKAPQMPEGREKFALIFGSFMILYGMYRGYRHYRKYFGNS